MSAVLSIPEPRPSIEKAVLRGQQVVMHGATWDDYLAWDARLGELGYGRVSYCDGILEIMSISQLHERVRRILGRLIEDYALSIGVNPDSAGSATIGERAKDAGKEPDDSFWFDREATGSDPDLILEVVVTSEAIDKRAFYARFGIPELWIWKEEKLTVWLLNGAKDGYSESGTSAIFPGLDISVVERCSLLPNLGEAIREFQKTL